MEKLSNKIDTKIGTPGPFIDSVEKVYKLTEIKNRKIRTRNFRRMNKIP